MRAQDIQAKIDKVSEAIQKKYELIGKRHSQIQKKLDILNKDAKDVLGAEPIGYDEDMDVLKERFAKAKEWYFENRIKDGDIEKSWSGYYWSICELEELVRSITEAQRTIIERTVTRERYFQQLQKMEEKEQSIEDMPQVIKDFMTRTVEMWDHYDINVKTPALREAKKMYSELSHQHCDLYNDWRNREANKPKVDRIKEEMRSITKQFSDDDWNNLLDKTEEQIHEENVESAKILVLNFYQRVCSIVGEIEDASGLRLDRNNLGYTIINGYAKGNGKTAKVESIGAGGYNIQRWHIRVLVHEMGAKKGVA